MNEKQFTIIWIVALVIILLAGGAAIWYLQFDVLVEKHAILDAVKKQVAIAKDKESKIKGLEETIKQLDKKANELASHIPNLDRAEYDVFAELLDDLRHKAGVVVSRANWMVPSRPTPIPGRTSAPQPASIHKVQYDMNVTGSFYQLLRYINLIEQQKRFIGVETFNVTKAGSDAGASKAAAPKRELKVTIYSYTYKLPTQPFVIESESQLVGHSTDIPD